MPNDNVTDLIELSEADLDEVTGGAGLMLNLNLSHLVNLNLAVGIQTAQNTSVLSSNVWQSITQSLGFSQSLTLYS